MKKTRFIRLCALMCATVLALSACTPAKTEDTAPETIPGMVMAYGTNEIVIPLSLISISHLCVTDDAAYFLGTTEKTVLPYGIDKKTGEIAALPDYERPPNTSIAALCLGEKSLWMLEYGIHFEPNGDERNVVLLRNLDYKGAEKSRIDISEALMWQSSMLLTAVERDSDGNFYILDTVGYINMLSPEGERLSYITSDVGVLLGLFKTSGSDVAALLLDMSTFHMNAAKLDAGSNVLGDSLTVTGASQKAFSGGNSFDYFYSDGIELHTSISGKTETLLNWSSCDIPGSSITAVAAMEDGKLLCAWTDGYGTAHLASMSKRFRPEESDKIKIRVAIYGVNIPLRNLVDDFNSKNDDIVVVVEEHSANTLGDTWDSPYDPADLERFNIAMLTNPPDVVLYPYSGNPDMLKKKGAFEDLYPFIDADEELGGREAFVEAAFRANEFDGKLYSVYGGFHVYAANTSGKFANGKTSWTLDDMRAIIDENPEIRQLYGNKTPMQNLEELFQMNLDGFVDWKSGTCSFDDGTFAKMLELASLSDITETPDWMSPTYMSADQLVLLGEALSSTGLITTFTDVQNIFFYNGLERGSDDIVYIGYPTDSGGGAAISSDSIELYMSSKSVNKDAAWKFMRTVLTTQYQTNEYTNLSSFFVYFPINKAVFNNLMEYCMTPQTEIDEYGNEIELPVASSSFYDFYAMTQEEADLILRIINSAENMYRRDPLLTPIIFEEAEAFFAGQKSADEVASIVQSRVSLYVSENS